jgi:hypothetical protein
LAAIAAYATISIAIACAVYILYCATPVAVFAVGATAVLNVLTITPAHTAYMLPHANHSTAHRRPTNILAQIFML